MRPRPSPHNVPGVLKLFGIGICTVVGFLATAPRADAGFNATLDSVTKNGGSYVTVKVENTDPSNPFGPSTVIAGQLNWTVSGSADNPFGGNNTPFGTFCIEIPKHVSLGSTYDFDQKPLSDLPTSRQPTMGDLKAAQIQAIWAAWHGSLVTSNASVTATNYAAFQLAIWEIVYDLSSTSDYDATAGTFRALNNPSVTAQANIYLASVKNSAFDGSNVLRTDSGTGTALARANVVGFQVTKNGTGDYQDQIAEVTPAPPAVVLLLSGFFPFVAFRRRFLNRAA